mmetsp:Transcript_22694/g.41755  ORF Transcript_22694/g.41755 Transcript_22694/m.41755 type:complete len:209 (+) Transcript_22694:105-731(+)
MSLEEQLQQDLERFKGILRLGTVVPEQVFASSDAIPAAKSQTAEEPSSTFNYSGFASMIAMKGITTLQAHGLPQWASVEGLVAALNLMGFQGCYNYIHVPRHMDGTVLGYSFINFTSVKDAAMFAAAAEQVPLQFCSDDGELSRHYLCLLPATKQGYAACTTEKVMQQFQRIRNKKLWPFVASRDGSTILMATPQVAQAAQWARQVSC